MKETKFDWSMVVRVLIRILTIGLCHVEKHKKEDPEE